MTPGYKTSEFWITVVVAILGWVMASGYICTDHDNTVQAIACKVIGGLLAIASVTGYNAARAKIKAAIASTPDSPYDPTKS